ncbi:MAG: type I-MYXAN CRISPR-associated protein Cas6/Cmx6 [Gammaproteobacteria bacterium]
MYWEEEKKSKPEYQVPDDVMDLIFKIECKVISLDHAQSLCSALCNALPWLQDEPLAGIHLIHAAESGNGWIRPEISENEVLNLSKRTKLQLRLPKHRIEDAQKLEGMTIIVDDYKLNIRESASRKLTKSPIIFSRHVLSEDSDEAEFLTKVHQQLKEMGVRVRKMMCGKRCKHKLKSDTMMTRSLMIAELDVEESVLLQQQGLGAARLLGCGLFLPHKGIIAVNDTNDKIQTKDF